MSDEPKTIKFQLMLSESEAKEIDDWGFDNRIRSRAEAIRRLCKIALKQKGQMDLLDKLLQGGLDWGSKTLDWTSDHVDEGEYAQPHRVSALFTYMGILTAKTLVGDLRNSEQSLSTIDDFEKAVEEAAKLSEHSLANREVMADFLQTLKDKFPEKFKKDQT